MTPAAVRRMILEGFGVDDVHIISGLKYRYIAQCLKPSKSLERWRRLAEARGSE